MVDPVTGLADHRQRWLDPETGSWLSRDPLGVHESPNLYQGFLADPLRRVDPWGLRTEFWPSGPPSNDPLDGLWFNKRGGHGPQGGGPCSAAFAMRVDSCAEAYRTKRGQTASAWEAFAHGFIIGAVSTEAGKVGVAVGAKVLGKKAAASAVGGPVGWIASAVASLAMGTYSAVQQNRENSNILEESTVERRMCIENACLNLLECMSRQDPSYDWNDLPETCLDSLVARLWISPDGKTWIWEGPTPAPSTFDENGRVRLGPFETPEDLW